MRVTLMFVSGCTVALLGGSPSLGSAPAQETQPAAPRGPEARRIEVYNGPTRTVTYDLTGLSPRLQALYRQLELAENELSLTDQLDALKQEYVNNERKLESRRTWQQLYGYPGPSGAGSLYGSYLGAGGYGGSVLKNTVAPVLGLSSTAGYRLQVITNLEEAQRSLAEEEERERTQPPRPAGADKGRPPAPADTKPERTAPPPPAAQRPEETSKVAPATPRRKGSAKRVPAAAPPLATDPESLAHYVNAQFERVSRELAPAASASGATQRAQVPLDPLTRAILAMPRPPIALPDAGTIPWPPSVNSAAPPAVSPWSDRLGWLSAGAMACISLLTLGWSFRRAIMRE